MLGGNPLVVQLVVHYFLHITVIIMLGPSNRGTLAMDMDGNRDAVILLF
jgi:hypothetical protein